MEIPFASVTNNLSLTCAAHLPLRTRWDASYALEPTFLPRPARCACSPSEPAPADLLQCQGPPRSDAARVRAAPERPSTECGTVCTHHPSTAGIGVTLFDVENSGRKTHRYVRFRTDLSRENAKNRAQSYSFPEPTLGSVASHSLRQRYPRCTPACAGVLSVVDSMRAQMKVAPFTHSTLAFAHRKFCARQCQ